MKLRRPSKKVIIISAILLVVLGTVGYAAASLNNWRGLEAELTAERQELESLRDTATNGDNQEERLAAIRELDDKMKTRNELCTTSPLFDWQADVVSPLRDGVAQCEQAVGQLDDLAAPLSDLRQYLDVAVKVQSSVEKLAPASDLTEQNWQELGLDRSRQVNRELKAVEARGDAAELKNQAIEQTDTLVSSWETLIAANKKRDVNGFLTASADVSTAYAAFAGLADIVEANIQEKATALESAAKNI